MPKKKPEPNLIMFRVRPGVPSDRDLARRIRRAAEVTGTPVSQLMRQALADKLKSLAKDHAELAAAS